MSGVDLRGPEVIRDFRAHLVRFVQQCTVALGARSAELNRARDWLRCEQLPYWRSQALRREEAYQNARRMWLEAESAVRDGMNTRGPRKPSSFEERLDMDRARKHRDEAEEKLALVKRWMLRLDQDGEPLIQSCQSHDFDLRERGERALRQLDHLTDRVHEYLAVPSGAGTPPAFAPAPTGSFSDPAAAAAPDPAAAPRPAQAGGGGGAVAADGDAPCPV